MMKGNIYVTTDMNIVISQFNTRDPNTKIIFLDEVDPGVIQTIRPVIGTILLPEYKGTCARLDNNMDQYRALYIEHLLGEECTSYIAVILRALMNGVNILIYTTKDSYEMYFPVLYEFILNSYGLSIGTAQTQPIFNTNFTPPICNLLYTLSLMSFKEFMLLYPATLVLDDNVVRKMIEDENPYTTDNQTFDWYKTYFYEYKEQTKQAGTFLQVVARKVGR